MSCRTELGSLLLGFLLLSAAPAQAYFGADHTQATLSFHHYVELSARHVPTEQEARERIALQLQYLFGPWAAAKFPAVPKTDQVISGIQIAPKAGAPGKFVISYDYRGTALIKAGSGAPTTSYPVTLPIDPTRIYAASEAPAPQAKHEHPCSREPDESDADDFWYFWNPNPKAGCPLREFVDYLVIQARIERLPNTTETYPEYARLADAQGNVKITYVLGMGDPDRSRNPKYSADDNAQVFRSVRTRLLNLGYSPRIWTAKEIHAVIDARVRVLPFVEEFTRTVTRDGQDHQLTVVIVFGQTGSNELSVPFHYFWRAGLQDSSVVIYNGHSGFGENIDPAKIEAAEGFRLEIPRDRYQIMVFNSCSSYTDFAGLYLARKSTDADPAGTKNGDIISYGLESPFLTSWKTDAALIDSITYWFNGRAPRSYQQIISRGDDGSFSGVLGDEDNE